MLSCQLIQSLWGQNTCMKNNNHRSHELLTKVKDSRLSRTQGNHDEESHLQVGAQSRLPQLRIADESGETNHCFHLALHSCIQIHKGAVFLFKVSQRHGSPNSTGVRSQKPHWSRGSAANYTWAVSARLFPCTKNFAVVHFFIYLFIFQWENLVCEIL